MRRLAFAFAVTLALACCRKSAPVPVSVIPAPATQLSRVQAIADPEGYSLRVDSEGQVTIEASADAGRFYAQQTLRQLGARPAAVEINDAPRYRWRGLHFDVARHFFPAKDIEHLLDLMALFKLNVFHWHLTDDQGWRLPIEGHPELTRPGPAYSREEIARIVAYAKARHITVVPEIDLPGHTRALLASHPELSCRGKPLELPSGPGIYEDVLCAGNPATYALVDEILEDVAAQFPGPYLHLGGDEVPTTRWDACPRCQALGLPKVQTYFLAKAAAKVRALGKRAIGWDEVLDHEAPSDLVVMAWRNLDRARTATAAGHDTILVPYSHTYFDRTQDPYADDPVTLDKLTRLEPDQLGLKAPHLLGIEAALWTERVATMQRAEVQLFPRLFGVADLAWSPAPARAANPLAQREAKGRDLLDSLGVSWFLGPPVGLHPRCAALDSRVVELRGTGVIHYTLDGSEPTRASPRYTEPLVITRTSELAARAFVGDRSSSTARGRVFIEPPLPALDLEPGPPGVRYEYFEGAFDALPDLEALHPARHGTSTTLIPAGVADRDWAIAIDGLFSVAFPNVHLFQLSSDDGARLWVDGHLVVDNDGLHAPRPRLGEIALTAGLHRVRLEHFQRGGGYALELLVDGAPIDLRQPP